MSCVPIRRSRSLIAAGFVLVVLANLGLTVHFGHHSLVVPYSAGTTQYLAEHSEPDATLHLEGITDIRALTCLGCVLQQQIGGSHLPGLGSLDQPATTDSQVLVSPVGPSTRWFAPRSPRAPPSC